jgi:hypothetical protein
MYFQFLSSAGFSVFFFPKTKYKVTQEAIVRVVKTILFIGTVFPYKTLSEMGRLHRPAKKLTFAHQNNLAGG